MRALPTQFSSGGSATILTSWQTIDEHLKACEIVDLPVADLSDFAIYYCCVYHALGRPADQILAQQLTQRLLAQPWPRSEDKWVLQEVDQACALAWLSTHCAAVGLPMASLSAQLTALDESLYQHTQRLKAQPASENRPILLRVVRYLRLRLAVPTAKDKLCALLDSWPQQLTLEKNAPLATGLVDGLAAELLVLIRVHEAGVRHSNIQARVQEGVRLLLSVKRGVDFLEHKYSVFPDQIFSLTHGGTFSEELSWQRGDVAQSWLLYQAQNLLQDIELAKIAELVGLNTVLRTSVFTTKVVRADLYCGAAGLAHLYAQLYRISDQPAYNAAYHFWVNSTQELLLAELATHTAAVTTQNKPLGGLIGIGLVLLTAANYEIAPWETMIV